MAPKTLFAAAALAALIASNLALAQEGGPLSVNDLSWIAGTWEGLGPDDYSGEEQALAIWTAPVEGVMSWTFRWHTPGNGHVHFAFTVLEDTDNGVLSRGIHHGRDFRPFEDARWMFRMTAASDTEVSFECIENCRVKSLAFELTEEGLLLEKYRPLDETQPLSVFRYRRLP